MIREAFFIAIKRGYEILDENVLIDFCPLCIMMTRH